MATDVTANIAGSMATGASAYTIALIGVDHYILLAAFAGSGLGVTASERLGLARTAWVFFFVMIGGAMTGPALAEGLSSWLSAPWLHGTLMQRFITFVASALLHATFAAALGRVEPLLRGWAARIGAEK